MDVVEDECRRMFRRQFAHVGAEPLDRGHSVRTRCPRAGAETAERYLEVEAGGETVGCDPPNVPIGAAQRGGQQRCLADTRSALQPDRAAAAEVEVFDRVMKLAQRRLTSDEGGAGPQCAPV